MKRRIRTTALVVADIFLLSISIMAAFLLRFDGQIPVEFSDII
jgi:hypothetical protein